MAHPYTRLGWTAVLMILATKSAALLIWAGLPPLGQTYTYILIALDATLLVWQISYGVRVAKIINGFPLTYSIWAVILIVSAATVTNALDRIADLHARPAVTTAQPAVLDVMDGTAFYAGEIDFRTFTALENTLKAEPDVKVLRISSNGGRIAAARGMARLVDEYGLDTEANDICASACTLVFIAGEQRTLHQNAKLGFHGYLLVSNILTIETKAEEERDKATFVARGVSPSFMDKVFAVPHDEMWFPPREVMVAAGVITR